MKKIKWTLLLIVLLILVGCVQENYHQTTVAEEISLKQVEHYHLADHSDFGLWSLYFDSSSLKGQIKISDQYQLIVAHRAYSIKKNPVNNDILEVFLPCEISKEVIQNSKIQVKQNVSNNIFDRNSITPSIDGVYIQRDQIENETSLYELTLINYLSLKNVNDPFILKEGKLIRPSYIKTNEENVYTLKRYYDARQVVNEINVSKALIFLKNRPDHNDLVFTGNPNRVTSITGNITVERPDKRDRLFQTGSEGEVNESSSYAWNILDDTVNGELNVVLNRSKLRNPDHHTYDIFRLYLKGATCCEFQSTSIGLFETVIPYAMTNNTHIVRNARFEAIKRPGKASLNYPVDSATDITINPTLSWNTAEDAVSYSIYFGTAPNTLQKIKGVFTETEYATNSLRNHEVYYWQVESVNASNVTNVTAVSSFTTSWFTDGHGTSEDPWQINSADQLNHVRYFTGDANTHYCFKQMASIDLSTFANWEPIGNDSEQFFGIYNGNGQTIINLHIDRSTETNVGLFARLSNATLCNVHVSTASVKGKDMVGILAAVLEDSSVVTLSSATGSLHANSMCSGGIAGANTSGIISECFTDVKLSATVLSGGIAGHNKGNIINCYSIGTLNGSDLIGGITGNNDRGTVKNCYATGQITGTGSNKGGLVGKNGNGTVTASFWDIETTSITDEGAGIGKSTADMKKKATFEDAEWKFYEDWNILEENDVISYPWLKDNPQTPEPGKSNL